MPGNNSQQKRDDRMSLRPSCDHSGDRRLDAPESQRNPVVSEDEGDDQYEKPLSY